MDSKRLSCLLFGIALGGCGTREQWLVSLYTDARIPQFGDRVLIDLLDDQGKPACPQCQHTVEAGDARRWPLSFGVDPALVGSGRGLHVRARLFRADHTVVPIDGDPIRDGAYLDALGRLPATPGSVSMGLRMDCFQSATDRSPGAFRTCAAQADGLVAEPLLQPTLPDAGALEPGRWAPGQDRPCAGSVPQGMVCVPGGAFMLGSLRYRGAPNLAVNYAAAPERLVILSPFAMDIDEFKVADLAKLRGQGKIVPSILVQGMGNDTNRLCTARGDATDASNQLPLTCVTRDQAQQLCQVRDAALRLPTEAEWEFAAGNRSLETTYPWGEEDAACERAVVGVSSSPFDPGASSWYGLDLSCRVDAGGKVRGWGPVAGGNPADRTLLGIRNLGGNAAEWCADDLSSYDDARVGRLPCPGRNPRRTWWVDPLCKILDTSLKVVRGGQWLDTPLRARSTERSSAYRNGPLMQSPYPQDFATGFRCVRSMTK